MDCYISGLLSKSPPAAVTNPDVHASLHTHRHPSGSPSCVSRTHCPPLEFESQPCSLHVPSGWQSHGCSVGAAVGVTVGADVGAGVGLSLGEVVGPTVGAADGAAVGATVAVHWCPVWLPAHPAVHMNLG